MKRISFITSFIVAVVLTFSVDKYSPHKEWNKTILTNRVSLAGLKITMKLIAVLISA